MVTDNGESVKINEKEPKAPQEIAFVAGATGYTGQSLIPILLRRNIRVLAHIRSDSSRREYWENHFSSLGAFPICCPWELSDLKATLSAEQPNYIYALVGTTRARASRAARSGGRAEDESYERVDYGLTAMLIQAAQGCTRLSRFLYLSALGVDAGAKNAYMNARWKAERDLRESGLPYTVVRPALISGSDREESRTLERAGALSMDFLLSVGSKLGLSGANEAYRSITAPDLAESMADLANDAAWENCVALRKDLR